MRDWRKLHRAILTSERMPECSKDSLWLWTLLTAAQDDEGRYPWKRTKVYALCGIYKYTFDDATQCIHELVEAGIVVWDGPFVRLVNSEKYNGKPSDSRRADLYEEPDDDLLPRNAADLQGAAVQRGAMRCLDARASGEGDGEGDGEGEREKARAPKKRVTKVDQDFIDRMVEEFSTALGGDLGVRDRIDAAMGHKNFEKWNDKQRYIRDWLKRDTNGSVSHSTSRRMGTNGVDELRSDPRFQHLFGGEG